MKASAKDAQRDQLGLLSWVCFVALEQDPERLTPEDRQIDRRVHFHWAGVEGEVDQGRTMQTGRAGCEALHTKLSEA
jgi:hypothetical protein